MFGRLLVIGAAEKCENEHGEEMMSCREFGETSLRVEHVDELDVPQRAGCEQEPECRLTDVI